MSIRKASLNDDNNVISHTFQRCVGCNSVMVRFANQQTDFRKKSEKYSKTTQGRGSQLLRNKSRTAQSNKPCQLVPSRSRLLLMRLTASMTFAQGSSMHAQLYAHLTGPIRETSLISLIHEN